MRYCASATDSAVPVMVMVRSELLSRSSQLEMRIMAPLICLERRHGRNEHEFNIGASQKSARHLRLASKSSPARSGPPLSSTIHERSELSAPRFRARFPHGDARLNRVKRTGNATCPGRVQLARKEALATLNSTERGIIPRSLREKRWERARRGIRQLETPASQSRPIRRRARRHDPPM